MTKMTVLHVEENKLSELPKTMGRLASLKQIYLQNNRLEKLSGGLGKCSKLETINCEDNQITGISKKIADLENLKYLLLANNNLKDLSGLQEKLASRGLRRMTLRGNKLDASLMKLDTDVQEEMKKSGASKISVGGVTESKGDDDFAQKMGNLGGIQEGDEDEDDD
jgi:Leucine-rich repeat (LRR) protein